MIKTKPNQRKIFSFYYKAHFSLTSQHKRHLNQNFYHQLIISISIEFWRLILQPCTSTMHIRHHGSVVLRAMCSCVEANENRRCHVLIFYLFYYEFMKNLSSKSIFMKLFKQNFEELNNHLR